MEDAQICLKISYFLLSFTLGQAETRTKFESPPKSNAELKKAEFAERFYFFILRHYDLRRDVA